MSQKERIISLISKSVCHFYSDDIYKVVVEEMAQDQDAMLMSDVKNVEVIGKPNILKELNPIFFANKSNSVSADKYMVEYNEACSYLSNLVDSTIDELRLAGLLSSSKVYLDKDEDPGVYVTRFINTFSLAEDLKFQVSECLSSLEESSDFSNLTSMDDLPHFNSIGFYYKLNSILNTIDELNLDVDDFDIDVKKFILSSASKSESVLETTFTRGDFKEYLPNHIANLEEEEYLKSDCRYYNENYILYEMFLNSVYNKDLESSFIRNLINKVKIKETDEIYKREQEKQR